MNFELFPLVLSLPDTAQVLSLALVIYAFRLHGHEDVPLSTQILR